MGKNIIKVFILLYIRFIFYLSLVMEQQVSFFHSISVIDEFKLIFICR